MNPQEDDPTFDCTIHGNRVCGADDGTLTYHFADGSSCILEAQRGEWDGESIVCQQPSLPDTAMQPAETDFTGLILVIILIITLVIQETVPNKRR
jgi:hypothetical protein